MSPEALARVITAPAASLPSADLARPRPAPTEVPAGLVRPAFLGQPPRSRTLSVVLRTSVPLALIGLWWYGSSSGAIPADILASPAQVVAALVELLESGQLQQFALASLERAISGVALGVVLGLTLGVAAGLNALGEDLVDPTMQMLRAVPFLALMPLFISWFGIDNEFKIVLIASSSTMPMYAYAYLGVRNVDRKMIEAARGFGLRGSGLLFRVILPAALPNLLMALRICLAISVVGLIAAEQVGTTEGIGYLVLLAKQYYRPDYMLLCVLLYAVLGLGFDAFIRALEALVHALAALRGGARMILQGLASATLERPAERSHRGNAAVHIRGLSKTFGSKRVLDGVDLDVPRGEFVVLLGASGTGKTTLLRILAGLEQPDRGVALVPEARTVVYQEPRLVPSMRALANVSIGQPGGKATRQRAEQALAEVGLSDRAKAWPATLSGGEAQRVALARALVREPELLLLDEPFASLDALTRLQMQDLVRALFAAHEPAVLLVTHDVEEAVALADRILILRDGRFVVDVRIDTPRPRDRGQPAFGAQRRRLLVELGVELPLAVS